MERMTGTSQAAAQPRKMACARSFAAAVLLLLLLVVPGCGDAEIFFSVNTGTILTNPACMLGTGRFNMLTQPGLVVVVAISENTNIILAGGSSGSCDDLNLNDSVEVSGWEEDGVVTAETIAVL